jgi:hypothetical protein
VVVDDHVAVRRGDHDGCHGVPVAPGQRLHVDDDLRLIGMAEEEDLVTVSIGNLLAEAVQDMFGEIAFHGRGRIHDGLTKNARRW